MDSPLKALNVAGSQGGNLNLWTRPRVKNPDGSLSTVSSMGMQDEDPNSPHFGKEILVPQVIPDATGKYYTDTKGDAARQRYYRTGEQLGVFDTPAESDRYGAQLHHDYERGQYDVPLATSRRAVDPTQLGAALRALLGTR